MGLGRLPLALAYGVSEIPLYVSALIKGFFQTQFLLEVAEAGPFAVGTVLLIGQIFEAINDPFVGQLTDKTKSRFGRRKSWLIFGTLPFLVIWVMLWWVPPMEKTRRWTYYLAMVILFSITNSAIAVPFHSWMPEIAKTYDDRTFFTLFNKALSLLFGVIFSFANSELIEAFKDKDGDVDYEKGYLISAGISGIVFLVCLITTVIFVPDVPSNRSSADEEGKPKRTILQKVLEYLKDLKEIFSNRAFLLLTLVYLLSWFSVNIVQSNLLLYVQIVLNRANHFSYLLITVQGSAIAFLFFWTWASRTFLGKKYCFVIGIAISVLVEIVTYFVEHDDILILYFLCAFAGTGIAASFLLPWAMLPDVVQYDYVLYGRRREGTMYSWFVVLQQAALAIGLSLSSYGLGVAGYDADKSHQPEAVKTILKWFVGPLPAVSYTLCFIPLLLYPITRAQQEEMTAQLQDKEKQKLLSDSNKVYGAPSETGYASSSPITPVSSMSNTSHTDSPNEEIVVESKE